MYVYIRFKFSIKISITQFIENLLDYFIREYNTLVNQILFR